MSEKCLPGGVSCYRCELCAQNLKQMSLFIEPHRHRQRRFVVSAQYKTSVVDEMLDLRCGVCAARIVSREFDNVVRLPHAMLTTHLNGVVMSTRAPPVHETHVALSVCGCVCECILLICRSP